MIDWSVDEVAYHEGCHFAIHNVNLIRYLNVLPIKLYTLNLELHNTMKKSWVKHYQWLCTFFNELLLNQRLVTVSIWNGDAHLTPNYISYTLINWLYFCCNSESNVEEDELVDRNICFLSSWRKSHMRGVLNFPMSRFSETWTMQDVLHLILVIDFYIWF